MSPSHDNPLLRAALRYARWGWSVFRLTPREKTPLAGSHSYLDATTDIIQIKKWWKEIPDANIGVACSSKTGPIVVDLDEPKEGEASGLKLYRGLHLEDTREASSREGRRHLYFAPMRNGTRIARTIRIRHRGIKHAMDILSDGGYVMVPPSVHPATGEPYVWLNQNRIIALPRAILQLVRGQDELQKVAPPLPDIIHEGERDELLTSLAGSMRRRGASVDGILAALREENANRVRPPLDDRQLVKIAHSIGKKEPAPKDAEHYTDLGNARRFIAAHRDTVRSIMIQHRPWQLWDTSRWVPDTTGMIQRYAKQTVREIFTVAGQIMDEDEREKAIKFAYASEAAARVKALLELAATEPELSTKPEAYDADPWLFNVQNGTLDLRTGTLAAHRCEDLITKLSPIVYDADATAPRWEQFLLEIMQGDADLVSFLQEAIGYSLTGDTREQCLFFLYGQGANGKSTFLETIRAMCGDYGMQSDFDTYLASRNEGPRNDLARMRGARLVTASEAGSLKDFDPKTVQALTGGDVVVARKLYEELSEFKPQQKLWLAANHKPVVKEQTTAFWRRMRLIPFTAYFPPGSQDRKLGKRLQKELPGILTWAVKGCALWRTSGLHIPAAIRKATKDYKEEGDKLGEFFTHACKLHPNAWTSTDVLYRAFVDWWLSTRGPRSNPVSPEWFGRMLSERTDIHQEKRQLVRGWRGVAVRTTVSIT